MSDTGGAPVKVQMLAWTATEKHFVVRADSPQKLTLRLFNYPAWQVTVNGTPTPTETSAVTGLMIIPIKAGEDDVRICFARTPDRLFGGALSLMSLVVLVTLWIRTVPQVRARTLGANLGTLSETKKSS